LLFNLNILDFNCAILHIVKLVLLSDKIQSHFVSLVLIFDDNVEVFLNDFLEVESKLVFSVVLDVREEEILGNLVSSKENSN